MRADTRIRISDKDGAKRTVVSQDFGQIVVDVEKRNVQHFEVRAPLLAAVVKGTKFTVTAVRGGGAASIAVERGRVEARDDRAGMKVDVKPRQKVELNVKDKPVLTVEGRGAKEPIRSTATNKVLTVKEIIKKAEKSAPKAPVKLAEVEKIAQQQGQQLTNSDLDYAAEKEMKAAKKSGDATAIAEANATVQVVKANSVSTASSAASATAVNANAAAQNAQNAAAIAAQAEAEKKAAEQALKDAKKSGDQAAIDAAKDAVESSERRGRGG